MISKRSFLLNKFIFGNKSVDKSLSLDEKFNIGNAKQFKNDKNIFSYTQLCMIKIENSELLLSYVGKEKYIDSLSSIVENIIQYIADNNFTSIVCPYIINHKTLVLSPKADFCKEDFVNFCKKMQICLNNIKFPDDNSIILRFALVMDKSRMIDVANDELSRKRNAQKDFIVCDASGTKDMSMENELNIINAILWAMNNNGVIPYYQGIYNNRINKIDKYEALMRIVDSEGKIYAPGVFLPVAKKYHMYSKLSKMMVSRVLREVDERDFVVSINISASDINSGDFKNFLFEQLENRKSNKMLVFEILEDELFDEPMILQEFIDNVKKFGARIAIDDFGSGYSNLAEVAQVAPHYIKIDGGIISGVSDSHKNRAILESVVYLAGKINSCTVAEYVENEEIQKYIKSYNIDFSQGYLFSKPRPLSQIDI